MDKESGNSRGFGYVTFSDPGAAEAAKSALQGSVGLIYSNIHCSEH
jgi:RNA recognition motif-containing protein